MTQTGVTDSSSVKDLVVQGLQKYRRIDVLLNNVGRFKPGFVQPMSEDVWNSQININLNILYLTCHHILPIMEQRASGGAVVNVSSIAGLRYIGKPQVAYSATRAAIMQFIKTTAVESGLIYTSYTQELADLYAPGGDEAAYMKKRDH